MREGAGARRRPPSFSSPAAFAAHEDELYVALHSNEVKVSPDGGRA